MIRKKVEIQKFDSDCYKELCLGQEQIRLQAKQK